MMLYLDRKPIATELVVVHERVASSLKTAFDLDYGKYSAGNLVLWQMIDQLQENDDIVEIDLGPGEEAYKKSLSMSKRSYYGVSAANLRRPGSVLKFTIMSIRIALLNVVRWVASLIRRA